MLEQCGPDAADDRTDRQPPPKAVREELQGILASTEFNASDRLKSFLQFVVEEALAGRADRLKGYTIGVEVFGRDPAFDPQNDPVVRMEAGKLRRRLDLYYLEGGRADPVRIQIPKGSYVPTFSWQGAGESADDAVVEASPSRRRSLKHGLWALGGLALAGLVLVTALWLRSEALTQQAAVERPAPQERGPAIIVLPFEDLSKADTGDVFAAGLTEELISNLMRFGELRLYSAYASFQEKPSADPVEVGQRLDVGYVVKGSVRRDADRVRLTVHLIKAQIGQYLWSQTYDRALTPENVFAVQEQLAADLASHLAQPYGIINEITADAFRQQRPETLFAYDCVLRAFAYRRTNDRELYGPSRGCLEQAVLRDPGYADAWALLAFAQLDEYRFGGYGPSSYDPAALDRAMSTARHAAELDADNVYVLLALSTLDFYRREFAEADEINRRLLSLYSTNPEVLGSGRLAHRLRREIGIGASPSFDVPSIAASLHPGSTPWLSRSMTTGGAATRRRSRKSSRSWERAPSSFRSSWQPFTASWGTRTKRGARLTGPRHSTHFSWKTRGPPCGVTTLPRI